MGQPLELPFWGIVSSIWLEAQASDEFIQLMKAALSPFEDEGTGGLSKLTRLPGLCCQAVGGRLERVAELTAAWYLFYIAAHIMDSVEDHDPQESWWAGQNDSVGINAATGLYFTANAALTRFVESLASNQLSLQVSNDFYLTLIKMTGGQHLDISHTDLSLEQYWQVATDKSGAFFSLACRSGARLGGGSADQTDALSRYGRELGILIQVLDDLDAVQHYLDPQAEAERVHFRHSLPAVYTLQFSPLELRKRLSDLLVEAPADLQKAAQALEIIEASGAGLYMLAEVQRHRTAALAALDDVSLVEETKESLVNLIDKMTTPP